MKKWLPWIIAGLFAAWIIGNLRPAREKTEFNTAEFGRLPVLLAGRIQPLDSVGMNALVSMRGKRTVGKEERKPGDSMFKRIPRIDATTWLMEVLIRPAEADQYKVFRVQHPDLQSMLGGMAEGLEYYSFNDLVADKNAFGKIVNQAESLLQAERKDKDAAQLRTPFQKDLVHLYQSVALYQTRLKSSLMPEGSPHFVEEFRKAVQAATTVLQQQDGKADANDPEKVPAELVAVQRFREAFEEMNHRAYALIIPPLDAKESRENWTNVGAALYASAQIHPAVDCYARMGVAFEHDKPVEFNRAIAEYKQWLLSNGFESEVAKGRQEFFFNRAEPFYKAAVVYVAAMLLGCVFWLNWFQPLRQSAFYLLVLAFVVHTVGLIFRMHLEGRPPVTNLYSSAIFVGWGSVLLGLILERIFRDGIGLVAAAFIGFVTLIIAHHLAKSGDTMTMLQAVLDTNIWLSTHVVVITTGYASMFLAGLLATIYIVRGLFTSALTEATAKSLTRMVYGIVCFSTLFSFVGTILGGIWADQSWGRFWGWDPKENGALLIVLWCAVMLHARWGGLVKERGLMALAIFGNIVTSFSWFGVNMLGVGLHSYGFMDEAFKWLIGFIISQLALIGLALLPERHWKSFRGRTAISEKRPPAPGKQFTPSPAVG